MTETLIFLAATTAAAAALLSAFYTSKALSAQHRNLTIAQSEAFSRIKLEQEQFDLRIEFEKKKVAFSLASRWNDPSMAQARRTCRELMDLKDHSLAQIKNALGSDEKLDDVIHLLNFIEEVGVAEEEGIADTKLLNNFFSPIVIQLWSILESWIKEYRNIRANKAIWNKFETLKNTWITKTTPTPN